MQVREYQMPLHGCRATVMGLGRHGGGVVAVRFLASQGAHVTVTDVASADSLRESVQQLDDLTLAGMRLGGHIAADFENADLVIVNPAVQPHNPFVQIAQRAGAAITSEIELFLARNPAAVIAVTGSNGKSTTAAMIAAALDTAGRRAWLGGNIQRSLLPVVDQIAASDAVVLELSSFQLAWLDPSVPRPAIAVITGCTPNHLDWHGSYADYVAAKQQIIARGDAEQVVITHPDADVEEFRKITGRRWRPPLALDDLPRLRVPGHHNLRNAALAAAAALAAGCEQSAACEGLSRFDGLPHRLQTVGQIAGRRLINDSQATTPEATIGALQAVSGRCWLLAGGADKGCPLDTLAEKIVALASGAACYGQLGGALHDELVRRQPDFAACHTQTLADAFAWCWQRSRSGDTILLSPACSSRDQYRDYADRAADFLRCIDKLTGGTAHQRSTARLL